MHCKNCGHALSLNSAVCPNCGMLMTEEQMKTKKEINGYNNPYMQRLNEINKDSSKYKLNQNEKNINISAILMIMVVLVIIIVFAIILYFQNR